MPTKLFCSLTESHKAGLKAALAAASLAVTAVEGGPAASPTESTHVTANQMRLRLMWSAPPSLEELTAASEVIAGFPWN